MNSAGLIFILLWFGVAGSAVFAAGIYGWLTPLVAVGVFLLLTLITVRYINLNNNIIKPFSAIEKGLLLILMCILTLHSLGLFVPETAFDALWYHLPEAQVYRATGKILPLPELLYSTMPRLGEMYATLAMFSDSAVVVKSVSYLFLVWYGMVIYMIARLHLSRPLSLLTVITIYSFPLVGWQSTSAYIDIIRAVFELASLYCLVIYLKKSSQETTPGVAGWLVNSAILSGFALSTKMHSFIHLFAMLAILIYKKRYQLAIGYALVAVFLASPWYINNYLFSGHPFYPANTVEKVGDQLHHAGAGVMGEWMMNQMVRLPLIPVNLSHPRQQLSPIILLFFPILMWRLPRLLARRDIRLLMGYCFLVSLAWWFIPPPESRYLLGMLPVGIMLLIYSTVSLSEKYQQIKNISFIALFISLFITASIRLAASYKYLPLFTGKITREQYIHNQTTDFNHSIIEKYYSGYWQKYLYK